MTVRGTNAEGPPAQASGGGYNSSLAAGSITLAAPLQPGQSINVQFLLGIRQTGTFRFLINIEALSEASSASPNSISAPVGDGDQKKKNKSAEPRTSASRPDQ